MSNHERGATVPNREMIERYGELYGVAPRDLLFAEHIKPLNRDGVSEPSNTVYLTPAQHDATARLLLPRELGAMAHRFLAEAHEAGADDAFLRYARHSLEDPELAEMYAGGLDEEGHPMTAEEQRDDYEALIDALRLIMKRRLVRARKP